MALHKKLRLFSNFLFLVLLNACGGDRFDSIRNIRSSGESIICFGDSLTEGVGAGSGEEYPTLLSRQLALPVIMPDCVATRVRKLWSGSPRRC